MSVLDVCHSCPTCRGTQQCHSLRRPPFCFGTRVVKAGSALVPVKGPLSPEPSLSLSLRNPDRLKSYGGQTKSKVFIPTVSFSKEVHGKHSALAPVKVHNVWVNLKLLVLIPVTANVWAQQTPSSHSSRWLSWSARFTLKLISVPRPRSPQPSIQMGGFLALVSTLSTSLGFGM
jgi:hypothetical protein